MALSSSDSVWRRCSSVAWSLANSRGWPTREPRGSACFHLPMAGLHVHAWLCHMGYRNELRFYKHPPTAPPPKPTCGSRHCHTGRLPTQVFTLVSHTALRSCRNGRTQDHNTLQHMRTVPVSAAASGKLSRCSLTTLPEEGVTMLKALDHPPRSEVMSLFKENNAHQLTCSQVTQLASPWQPGEATSTCGVMREEGKGQDKNRLADAGAVTNGSPHHTAECQPLDTT